MNTYVVNWYWVWLALAMTPAVWAMVWRGRTARCSAYEVVDGLSEGRDRNEPTMLMTEPMDHVGDWILKDGHIDWETVTALVDEGRIEQLVEALTRCGPIADEVDADFRRSLLYFLIDQQEGCDELLVMGLIRERVDCVVQSIVGDGRIDWQAVAERIRGGRVDETIEALTRCGPVADDVEAGYRRSLIDMPAVKAHVAGGRVDDAVQVLETALGTLPVRARLGSSDA